jgi:hypothetical protein
MKRNILLIGLTVLLVASCEYDPYYTTFADFSVEFTSVTPGESVSFFNYSHEATHFEWDFGDGTYSTKANPVHYYSSEGVYNVRLAAYRGSTVDYAYLTMEVYETSLEIKVVDSYTGELVPGVNVIIYPSYDSYVYYGAEVFRGVSDYNGRVVVKGLNTQSYYIDAYSNLYNNWSLAIYDVNYIETEPLAYATHNIFIAKVEYDVRNLKSTVQRSGEVAKIE